MKLSFNVWSWQINFEDCWLEYIHPGAFSGLERLSALNLVNNELRALDSAMRATLPSTLRVVRLYRNPWTCNCRLRWLRRWLVSRADSADSTINWDFASNTPTCAAPALIRGVAWRHLTADQFACPSRIIAVSAAGTSGNWTTTTGIRATSGQNATVKCMAAGDPEPIISWSRGDDGEHILAPPRALISVRQGTVGDDGEPRIVSVLTLLSVSQSRDSGDYSCMAENTAGRAEMTFKLMVDNAPLAGTSRSGLLPIDRDAFLGIVIGLLAVACIVVLCTVLRLRNIARHRRRLQSKNVYYVADTANHVGPSPTSNHRPPTDIESAPTAAHTTVDDEDSKSSEEQSFVKDGEATTGSPRYPLLANYSQHCWSEEDARRGRRKHGEASCRTERSGNSGEARSLLSAVADNELEAGNSVTEDELRDHDDDVSLSEKLSDDASDDTDDARTNGDDDANYRERPSRAVSFGPDMIIDARRRSSSGGERDDSSHNNNDVVDGDGDGDVKCEYDDEDRGQSVHRRHNEPVFQHSAVNCSPSVRRRPVDNRASVSADHRTTTPSPTLSVGDDPRLTVAGRRHSGELRLVGNGSVRSGLGSRLLDHPQTETPTSAPFSRARPSSQSASLERNTRRRLPIPINTALRRFPGPGIFGGIGRRQGALSPRRDVALPVADCTPVSLAELLAPPFGGSAATTRQLQTVKPVNDSRRPTRPQQRTNTNIIFDDDSGTDI